MRSRGSSDGAPPATTASMPSSSAGEQPVGALVRRMQAARHLLLLLDYDGTLVPFASTPELAMPDDALVHLLRALAARPRTQVHIVSGRRRETLERWLGHLSIGLHAEHGFCTRPLGGPWIVPQQPRLDWRGRVRAILEQFAARTPGSLVEEKTAGLAWHYRMADAVLGPARADELHRHLSELFRDHPVDILAGKKVIEVRPRGVHKGSIVTPLLQSLAPGTLLVAMGDDRTDEDLFAAMPADAITIHVGADPSRASARLASPQEARRMLAALLDEPPTPASA